MICRVQSCGEALPLLYPLWQDPEAVRPLICFSHHCKVSSPKKTRRTFQLQKLCYVQPVLSPCPLFTRWKKVSLWGFIVCVLLHLSVSLTYKFPAPCIGHFSASFYSRNFSLLSMCVVASRQKQIFSLSPSKYNRFCPRHSWVKKRRERGSWQGGRLKSQVLLFSSFSKWRAVARVVYAVTAGSGETTW